ncbi:MAG: hypothetical protein SFX18_13360 [Pirellulales bacterium]|nr:hypothetical protein [Pirellulales bacterium]
MKSTKNNQVISFYVRNAIRKYNQDFKSEILRLAGERHGQCRNMTQTELSECIADAIHNVMSKNTPVPIDVDFSLQEQTLEELKRGDLVDMEQLIDELECSITS